TAARLMNGAPTGQIWVGPETAVLVGAEFQWNDEGLIDFKGKAKPLKVASLSGASNHGPSPEAAVSFRSAFVGRQAEFGALLGAAEAMRDGRHQAYGICGDAGSGKSRLITEFRLQLGDTVNWLEGRAYSYSTDIPYAPLIDLMRRTWGIEGGDSPATVRTKIEAGLAILFGSDKSDLPLFLHLFDLPQDGGTVIERESFRAQLGEVMRRVSAGLAGLGPTVVCFQDLHWSDPSTRELVAQMATDTNSAIMLLANYRPGYTPPPGMQELSLAELSPRQTGEMLNSLLGGEAPAELSQFVTDRCDGNPFYVEEVVNSLRETGLLRQEDQQWMLQGPLTESSVPATIRGVIAARIDRLDDARRRLLREAAVIGREFLVKVVELVGTNIDDLATGLNQLQSADLIRQGRLEPSLAYMFKHALTQDVAYEGLLKSDRQELHSRTASAMEEVFSDRIGEYVETLAFHFQRGGDTNKAINYLIQAGTKCLDRYALAEAEKHFRDAYALCSTVDLTPEKRHALVRLLVSWSQLHYYLGTVDEWIGLLNKHLPDAEACGDDSLLTQYLAWMGNVLTFHGDFPASETQLERGYQLARQTGNRDDYLFISAYRMYTMFERLRLTEAV
ncbi:MAG: AAA family ATPase, partial [Burkholderiaceae bacterium]